MLGLWFLAFRVVLGVYGFRVLDLSEVLGGAFRGDVCSPGHARSSGLRVEDFGFTA